jgi:hypothetical protein
MPAATPHADSFGNPLTLDDAASLPLLEDFVMGFVSTEARAVNLLALGDSDPSPIVQAYCATLHPLSRQGPRRSCACHAA